MTANKLYLEFSKLSTETCRLNEPASNEAASRGGERFFKWFSGAEDEHVGLLLLAVSEPEHL